MNSGTITDLLVKFGNSVDSVEKGEEQQQEDIGDYSKALSIQCASHDSDDEEERGMSEPDIFSVKTIRCGGSDIDEEPMDSIDDLKKQLYEGQRFINQQCDTIKSQEKVIELFEELHQRQDTDINSLKKKIKSLQDKHNAVKRVDQRKVRPTRPTQPTPVERPQRTLELPRRNEVFAIYRKDTLIASMDRQLISAPARKRELEAAGLNRDHILSAMPMNSQYSWADFREFMVGHNGLRRKTIQNTIKPGANIQTHEILPGLHIENFAKEYGLSDEEKKWVQSFQEVAGFLPSDQTRMDRYLKRKTVPQNVKK